MTSSLSVLLVEDDAAHAEITRRNIEEFDRGLRSFVHVKDGQAALDHLDAQGAAEGVHRLGQLWFPAAPLPDRGLVVPHQNLRHPSPSLDQHPVPGQQIRALP